MVPYLLDYTSLALTVALYLAVAFVLMRKYLRTRDVGLLWLGAAVVIWPWVSWLLHTGELALIDRRSHSYVAMHFPFSLIERGQVSAGELLRLLYLLNELVALGLLLVAVLHLYKTKSTADVREID